MSPLLAAAHVDFLGLWVKETRCSRGRGTGFGPGQRSCRVSLPLELRE